MACLSGFVPITSPVQNHPCWIWTCYTKLLHQTTWTINLKFITFIQTACVQGQFRPNAWLQYSPRVKTVGNAKSDFYWSVGKQQPKAACLFITGRLIWHTMYSYYILLRGYSVRTTNLNLHLSVNLELLYSRSQHGAIFVPADVSHRVASQF